MSKLGAALGWKFNHAEGIKTVGGKLVDWPDALGPKPDQAGIDAILAEYQSAQAAVAYKDKRKAEYPAMGDQLDAIWKQLNQDRFEGKAMIQDVDDQLGVINAVKNKYPKA